MLTKDRVGEIGMQNAQVVDEVESIADTHIHSFIVRVFVEESQSEPRSPIWHGQIQHIPGGEMRYFKNLSEITAFIETHLTTEQ